MSIWGKLGGGGIGLAVGGPLGALIGVFAGHYLVDREGAVLGPMPKDLVLTTGLVALAAKMARADGVVVTAEVTAFERIVIVSATDRHHVARLFALVQATIVGYEAYAAQLARVFADEPALLDDIVEGLFLIAKADGVVHAAELAYLRDVARIFGRSQGWFDGVLARHVELHGDPYRALGADRTMSDQDLKARHRELVRTLHPDRRIADGLPPEAIRIATHRLAGINAAWDEIARERRL